MAIDTTGVIWSATKNTRAEYFLKPTGERFKPKRVNQMKKTGPAGLRLYSDHIIFEDENISLSQILFANFIPYPTYSRREGVICLEIGFKHKPEVLVILEYPSVQRYNKENQEVTKQLRDKIIEIVPKEGFVVQDEIEMMEAVDNATEKADDWLRGRKTILAFAIVSIVILVIYQSM